MTQSKSPTKTVYSRASAGPWRHRSMRPVSIQVARSGASGAAERGHLGRQGGDGGFNRPSVGSNFVQYLEFIKDDAAGKGTRRGHRLRPWNAGGHA